MPTTSSIAAARRRLKDLSDLPYAKSGSVGHVLRIKRDRERQERKSINDAQALRTIRDAIAAHPADVRGQFGYFVERFDMDALTGKPRKASPSTKRAYFEAFNSLLNELDDKNMRLRSMDNLTVKHVTTVIKAYEETGKSAATITNRYSCFRRFVGWIRPDSKVPELKELVRDESRRGRREVATQGKDWESAGVDFWKVYDLVRQEDAHIGAMLLLQRLFGLRAQESYCFRPLEDCLTDQILVRRGTKGGKTRTVPVQTPEQERALEVCQELTIKRTGTLSPPGRSLRQTNDRVRYVMAKVGVTKKTLGVTMHGNRHSFAQEQYQEKSGLVAPVRLMGAGGANGALQLAGASEAPQMDKASDKAARQYVSRLLGHERPRITAAYVGSFPTLQRDARQRLDKWVAEIEGDAELQAVVGRINAMNLEHGRSLGLFLGGPQADGAMLVIGAPALFVIEWQPVSGSEVQAVTHASEQAQAALLAYAQQLVKPLSRIMKTFAAVATKERAMVEFAEPPMVVELLVRTATPVSLRRPSEGGAEGDGAPALT